MLAFMFRASQLIILLSALLELTQSLQEAASVSEISKRQLADILFTNQYSGFLKEQARNNRLHTIMRQLKSYKRSVDNGFLDASFSSLNEENRDQFHVFCFTRLYNNILEDGFTDTEAIEATQILSQVICPLVSQLSEELCEVAKQEANTWGRTKTNN